MLLEFQEALQYPRFATRLAAKGETPDSLMVRFRAAFHEAIPARVARPPELRDHDDLHVLACAVGVQADAIVTGDKDLLTMKSFEGIRITNAQEALKLIGVA